ncbi:hypothetical protein B0J11DRAFT_512193 [Dendryphion nanum]|uniref:Myb-like domain-containing protein n=1 Tax=Dendryphion nanum TaxID=256645 RepID=A0A9P9I828_9PLEO|nr:hypothetical protein B0J11DRAFT_512193 [Dendryphion nanum]
MSRLTSGRPMCIKRTREYLGAGGPERHREIQSDSSDSRNASRSTNYVPYELGEYGIHLHNDTLIPQTATRTKNASIRGPFPLPPRPWSPAEDQMLVNFMKSGSKRDWDIIAKRLPNRTKRACQLRYERLN